jgi:Fe-S-cluster containining protein
VALEGDGERADFRCRVYEARPSACADFEIAGDACLEARRRVGLSA